MEADMNLPLLHLQPDTCAMVANYHADFDNHEDASAWYRTALVLYTIDKYNHGKIEENTMRANLNVAFRADDDTMFEMVNQLLALGRQ